MRNNIRSIAAFQSIETSSLGLSKAFQLPEHTNHFMRNLLLAVIILCSALYSASSQACEFQEIQDGWTCETSVVICSSDIDGYTGTLPVEGQGNQPVPFCINGGSIENALWFSFVALDETVELLVTPANCTEGTSMFIGMQAAIYTECENNATIACQDSGTTDPITLTENSFIPGNTYYLLLDGYGGSVCDFTIDAVSGVADGTITLGTEGPNMISTTPAVDVCTEPDQIFSFEVPDCEVMGSSQFDFLFANGWTCYEWTILPNTFSFLGANNSPYIDVVFEAEGVYTISVERHLSPFLTDCGAGECLDPPSIEVVINFIDTVENKTVICAGEFVNICGIPTGAPGVYECLDENSCILFIDTIELNSPEVQSLGNIFLCADECFVLEGEQYCDRTDYFVVSAADCSQTYQFSLKDVSFTITPDPYPLLDCSGQGDIVSHNVSTNYSNNIFLKYIDSDGIVISESNFVNITEAGDYSFIVYGEGFEDSCADTIEFTIEIDNVSPDFSLESEILTCTDQLATVSSISLDNIDKYQWIGADIDGPTDGMTINVTEEGLYTLIVTGLNGCTGEQSITVVGDYEEIDVDIDWKNLDCNTAQTTLSYISSLTIDSVLWAGPNEFKEDEESPSATDTGTYALILYAENGCDYSEIFHILGEYKEPEFIASVPEEWACKTESLDIEIDYSSDLDYSQQWSTDEGIILSNNVDGKIISVGSTGLYFVEVTDGITGCTHVDTIFVSPDDEIPTDLEIEAASPLCYSINDGVIEIKDVEGGTGPFSYELDGIPQATNMITNLGPADYEVGVIDANGCEIKRMVEITEPIELIGDINGPSEANYGDNITVEAIVDQILFDIDQINWYDAVGLLLGSGEMINILVEGNIFLTMEIIDTKGCIITRTLPILLDEEYDYYVPNLFTPNNDGINDYFGIGTQNLPGRIGEFYVYDRWGNKMFEAKNIDNGVTDLSWGWDGRFKGRSVNPGVYVYYAVVETLGIEKQLKGSVTVVR